MIFEHHANLKYKYGNRHFWAEGYYVSMVGLNEVMIRKYISEQEKADMVQDKLSVKEYEDPFNLLDELRKAMIDYIEYHNNFRITIKGKDLTLV